MAEKYGSEETYKLIVTGLLENDNRYVTLTNDRNFISRIIALERLTGDRARERAGELIIFYCKIIEMIRQRKASGEILESYNDFPKERLGNIIQAFLAKQSGGGIKFPGDKVERGTPFDARAAARGMTHEGRKLREGPCLVLLSIFFFSFLFLVSL